jgi:TRAP-type C4-dicarboxylate transport system permease small subunit
MLLIIDRIRRAVEFVLILALLAMVLLTFADVIGRRFFNIPIYGAHDITEHMMAIIVFSGLPLLTSARGHLAVDLFDRFIMADSMRWWRALINFLICFVLLLISYQFLIAAIDAIHIQEVSQELLIPRSYMYAFISISCFVSSMASILPAQASKDVHPEDAL